MSKNLFLPNPIDKKRSLLLQPKMLVAYVLIASFTLLGTWRITSYKQNILGYATNIRVSELLNLTNDTRRQGGLSDLTINSKLSQAAKSKANDMFEDDYWAHTAPDGKEPWDFIKSQGYSYIYAGENLAVDFSDSEDVVKAWINSPSHRDNLLNSNYTEIGFAVVNGELQGRKTTLVVQMFGKPRYVEPKASSLADNSPVVEETKEVTGIEDIVPTAPADETSEVDTEIVSAAGSVLNATDVYSVSRMIAILLGVFLTAMFALDGIYVRKNGVLRLTGHTILHIVFLVLTILGIWYTNIGLVL